MREAPTELLLRYFIFYLAVPACGVSPGPGPQPGVCRTNVKGDGDCDDYNNNEKCQWDGGDCCGANVKKNYCDKCECLDPSQKCCAEFTIKDTGYLKNTDFKADGKLNGKPKYKARYFHYDLWFSLEYASGKWIIKFTEYKGKPYNLIRYTSTKKVDCPTEIEPNEWKFTHPSYTSKMTSITCKK